MMRPELSDSIMGMIFGDDEPGGDLTAEAWIRTYVDLDDLVAQCPDEDSLWLLARTMLEDAIISGCCEVDVGDMMEALLRHRHI